MALIVSKVILKQTQEKYLEFPVIEPWSEKKCWKPKCHSFVLMLWLVG